MRRNIGIVCMCLGGLLLLGALLLHLNNVNEAKQAQASVEHYLSQLLDAIAEPSTDTEEIPIDPDFYDPDMTVVTIDGYAFAGYLSIPKLGLQLPVLSETDNARLRIAPCRYSGSAKTDDLVIGAHNYEQHFGRLSNLEAGDEVYFTGIDGAVWAYTVVTIESLESNAVEDLTGGEYALTLYTCTYDGQDRVTVRCDRIG